MDLQSLISKYPAGIHHKTTCGECLALKRYLNYSNVTNPKLHALAPFLLSSILNAEDDWTVATAAENMRTCVQYIQSDLQVLIQKEILAVRQNMLDHFDEMGNWSRALMVWRTIIFVLGPVLHKDTVTLNSVLYIPEKAFKSTQKAAASEAFISWTELIDNFALNPDVLFNRKRLKLLLQPVTFVCNRSRGEEVYLACASTWWHLAIMLQENLNSCFDQVCMPLLQFACQVRFWSGKAPRGYQFSESLMLCGCEILLRILDVSSSETPAGLEMYPTVRASPLLAPVSPAIIAKNATALLEITTLALDFLKKVHTVLGFLLSQTLGKALLTLVELLQKEGGEGLQAAAASFSELCTKEKIQPPHSLEHLELNDNLTSSTDNISSDEHTNPENFLSCVLEFDSSSDVEIVGYEPPKPSTIDISSPVSEDSNDGLPDITMNVHLSTDVSTVDPNHRLLSQDFTQTFDSVDEREIVINVRSNPEFPMVLKENSPNVGSQDISQFLTQDIETKEKPKKTRKQKSVTSYVAKRRSKRLMDKANESDTQTPNVSVDKENNERSDSILVISSVESLSENEWLRNTEQSSKSNDLPSSLYESSRFLSDSVAMTDLTTQSSQEEAYDTESVDLNSQDPVYPDLTDCSENIQTILPHLTSSMWCKGLYTLLQKKNIKSIGDISRLTYPELLKLPFMEPKVKRLRSALKRYHQEQRTTTTSSNSSRGEERTAPVPFPVVFEKCSETRLPSSSGSAAEASKRHSLDKTKVSTTSPKTGTTQVASNVEPANRESRSTRVEQFLNQCTVEEVLEAHRLAQNILKRVVHK